MPTEKLAIDGGTPVRTRKFGRGHDFDEADSRALAEVIADGSIGSKRVRLFEKAFAQKVGAAHAVAVNSGTSALHTCVAAVNPDPGDEIIVTPWTSGGSIIGLLLQNGVPVFADVDDTYNIDPVDVERRITPRTRAIIAVHIFGNPCDMTALTAIAKRHGLFLIEDCCQAHFAAHQGKTVGTMGDINGFSFGGKHLSAGGGGAVTTDNESLWERALMFADAALPRPHNAMAGRPYANYFLAPNYKMSEFQAAVLLNQINKVDGYIERKIWAAQEINRGLADVPEITPQRVRPGDRNTYWHYGATIDTEALGVDAFRFAEMVAAEGVPFTGPYLLTPRYGPLYKNPFLAEPNLYGKSRFPLDYQRETPIDYRQWECPNGEELMGRGIVMPMVPSFTREDIDDIVTALRKVVAACKAHRRELVGAR